MTIDLNALRNDRAAYLAFTAEFRRSPGGQARLRSIYNWHGIDLSLIHI